MTAILPKIAARPSPTLVAGCRLPVAGCWLPVAGCKLLVADCWSLVDDLEV